MEILLLLAGFTSSGVFTFFAMRCAYERGVLQGRLIEVRENIAYLRRALVATEGEEALARLDEIERLNTML